MARAGKFLSTLLIVLVLPSCGMTAEQSPPPVAQVKPVRPDPSTFQSGDFVWPKGPHAIVPYDSSVGKAGEREQRQWEAERNSYLRKLESLASPSDLDKERYRLLSAMTYEQFLSVYLAADDPARVQPYGATGPFYVGHVGVVDMRDGVPWVVEAVMGDGVRAIQYSDWLAKREGEVVWHARLRGADVATRQTIAGTARSQTEPKKPYEFWNFDLSDDHGFYCSKLAWFSVWKVTGIALDGNSNPSRAIWFSPKQMLRSTAVDVLFSPGEY